MRVTIKGEEVLIDKEDLPLLLSHNWNILYTKGKKYLYIGGGNNKTFLHNILSNGEGEVTDHRNGNSLDYRRSNLVQTTYAVNTHNQAARGESGYKGVYKHRDKWQAQISYNYQRICLGSYKYPEEAAICYDIAALKLYGELARLNFPENKELYLQD